MEVFDTWSIADLVRGKMDVCMTVAMTLVTSFLALRIAVECFKVYAFNGMRFSVSPFISILVALVGLLCYDEIMPAIGDAFFGLGNEIRGEAENTFRMSGIWEALKAKLGTVDAEGQPKDTWDLVKDWARFILSKTDPWDGIQNYFGLATAMSWQLLAIAFRWLMIMFKNFVYGLMISIGPIPIVLSLIPGWQGLSAHWMKNFIVVCSWNVSLAFVDGFMDGLNVQIFMDIIVGGDEEMSIGLLTAFTAIMYFFIPFITSMWIGQTVVAMAGSKFVMTPLAAAMGIMRLAGAVSSGGATEVAGAAGKAASNAGQSATSSAALEAGSRNSSGLISMASPKNQPVRSSYDHYTTARPRPRTQPSRSAGALPQPAARLESADSRSVPAGNTTPSLPPPRSSAKYLLGPKK